MPSKIDRDTFPGVRLLRFFRKLMLDGRRHFQMDLAEEFQCSTQTIIRMVEDLESVIGANIESGKEGRKVWHQIRTLSRSRLGLEFEEVRYLSLCRDLAAAALPAQVKARVDDTIFNLSLLLSDQAYAVREQAQQPQLAFFAKGRIDYTPHFPVIEKLSRAAEERRVVLVQYKASGRSVGKEHRFAPGRMVSMNGALYVLGAGLTENFREIRHLTNLAVHRISDVTLTDRTHKFTLPDPEPGAFGLPWHDPKTFRIRFTPGKAADYVRERIWADKQKIEDLEDGGVLLEITTRSEPELMAWVRSFGEEAELKSISLKVW